MTLDFILTYIDTGLLIQPSYVLLWVLLTVQIPYQKNIFEILVCMLKRFLCGWKSLSQEGQEDFVG